jgi:hypothetical protein
LKLTHLRRGPQPAGERSRTGDSEKESKVKIKYEIELNPEEDPRNIQISLCADGVLVWKAITYTLKAAEDALLNAMKNGVEI